MTANKVKRKSTKGKGIRKPYVKRACTNCKAAHAACDSERPCKRCVSLGLENECADAERKKPAPRKPRAKKEKQAAVVQNEADASSSQAFPSASQGADIPLYPSLKEYLPFIMYPPSAGLPQPPSQFLLPNSLYQPNAFMQPAFSLVNSNLANGNGTIMPIANGIISLPQPQFSLVSASNSSSISTPIVSVATPTPPTPNAIAMPTPVRGSAAAPLQASSSSQALVVSNNNNNNNNSLAFFQKANNSNNPIPIPPVAPSNQLSSVKKNSSNNNQAVVASGTVANMDSEFMDLNNNYSAAKQEPAPFSPIVDIQPAEHDIQGIEFAELSPISPLSNSNMITQSGNAITASIQSNDANNQQHEAIFDHPHPYGTLLDDNKRKKRRLEDNVAAASEQEQQDEGVDINLITKNASILENQMMQDRGAAYENSNDFINSFLSRSPAANNNSENQDAMSSDDEDGVDNYDMNDELEQIVQNHQVVPVGASSLASAHSPASVNGSPQRKALSRNQLEDLLRVLYTRQQVQSQEIKELKNVVNDLRKLVISQHAEK